MNRLSRQQVRDIDRLAIEKLGIPGIILMENAGRNASDHIISFLGGVTGKKIAIVAGGGNNGGDGFVIARHLANAGACVVTFLVTDEERIVGDARVNYDIINALGHEIRPCLEPLDDFDLIVDAIGGTGISGCLRKKMAEAVNLINAAPTPVVAVDIPTGVDCDTGQVSGPAIVADLTVTFVAGKIGFENPSSCPYTGKVVISDIGVDPEVIYKFGFHDER